MNKNLHKTPFEKSEKIVSDIELNKMRQFTEIVDNIFHDKVDSSQMENQIKKILEITGSHIEILSKDLLKKLIVKHTSLPIYLIIFQYTVIIYLSKRIYH